MPVRLANTAGLQGDQLDAGLLAPEYREIVFVCLLLGTPVIRGRGQSGETEQVRLRGDRFRGDAGITKACRVIGHWLFLSGNAG